MWACPNHARTTRKARIQAIIDCENPRVSRAAQTSVLVRVRFPTNPVRAETGAITHPADDETRGARFPPRMQEFRLRLARSRRSTTGSHALVSPDYSGRFRVPFAVLFSPFREQTPDWPNTPRPHRAWCGVHRPAASGCRYGNARAVDGLLPRCGSNGTCPHERGAQSLTGGAAYKGHSAPSVFGDTGCRMPTHGIRRRVPSAWDRRCASGTLGCGAAITRPRIMSPVGNRPKER